MKKKNIEESLHLPTNDALEQALSFLQNSDSPDDIKLSDLKKAVACIDNGEKDPENLLPEFNNDNSSDDEENPLNELLEDSTEDIIQEENSEPEITLEDVKDEEKVSELLKNIESESKELEMVEENVEITYANLPSDASYCKEMDEIYNKSIYAYRELFDFAVNASSGKSVAEIASASQSFLKLAYDAKNSKLKHKLDLHKASLEERKMKLAELKAFKEAGTQSVETASIMEQEQVQGIKMTPSMREQLIKSNLEELNKDKK